MEFLESETYIPDIVECGMVTYYSQNGTPPLNVTTL
jgi:hypothetical protein